MALSLNYPSPFGGADFAYFIVGEVRENRYHGNAEIMMYGFIDHAARQALASYLPVAVSIDSASWIKDATIAQIYGMVKETPEFTAAVDA